ncbi:hypothetical protein [Ammoniphilus resinae]|uniref:Uncharacterized protein YpiB (UPF0302 family) n=1 Tax=Ammoniphilus resinae TaxID=861532 RepID=A0ABS4GY50_9BACL|nr:hypothetical protein [Ammoniphilus resinae]MBP1935037.1 uncharacterized protein YpiB (UPF0302 family) [Ammoniphilus resinae]
MTNQTKVTLFRFNKSTVIRDIDNVASVLEEKQFDKLLYILQDLDIWSQRNNVCIEFEGGSRK